MEVFENGRFAGMVTQKGGLPGLTACITTYTIAGFNDNMHYHTNANIGFAIEGVYMEEKKKLYTVSPGSMCCYGVGELHRFIEIKKAGKRINLELENSFLIENKLDERDVEKAILSTPDAKFHMLKIYRELCEQNMLSGASVAMLFMQIIFRVEKSHRKVPPPPWVNTIDNYMRDSLTDNISLDMLSAITSLHPITICKYFPKYFGCTAGEYLRKLKVEKSLSMIKNPALSLTQIAHACGFFDQSHFIRVFKQMTGFLPGCYKKS